MSQRLRNFLSHLYPVPVALWPVLAIYDHNKEIAEPSYLVQPLVVVAVAAVAVCVLVRRFIAHDTKAALVSAVLFLMFSAYGHVIRLLIDGVPHTRHYAILLFIWALIFTAVTALIVTSRRPLTMVNTYANIFTAVLIVMSIYSITVYQLAKVSPSSERGDASLSVSENLPDIYYVIFDGYARQDILSQYYDYDNEPFLQSLEQLGFYVSRDSRSNYSQTYLSVTSALNFDYIENFITPLDKDSHDRGLLRDKLRHNAVQDNLKQAGYQFVTLPATWTGIYKNQLSDIDLTRRLSKNDFTDLLVEVFLGHAKNHDDDRLRIRYLFQTVPEVAHIPGPTFTYVHFLSPHPPFIFGAQGEAVDLDGYRLGVDGDDYFKFLPDRAEYRQHYRDQLQYINGQALTMINTIIAQSDQTPIIILQSDHGPGSMLYHNDPAQTNMAERLSNLGAYYVPDAVKQNLYQNITPINMWRVVLNGTLNTQLPLVADRSYFATWDRPYDFIDVTDQL